MGKKARIKRERRQKELTKSQLPDTPEAEGAKALEEDQTRDTQDKLIISDFDIQKIKSHVRRVDPDIEKTICEALRIRQLYKRQRANRFVLYLKCAELMRHYHYPKTVCPDCGIDCAYQKEPPLPIPAVLIQDLGAQIAIKILNPKSLSIHNKLTKVSLKSILYGEDQLRHSTEECKRMGYKAVDELRDLLSQVTKEVVKEYGTANLTLEAQKRLKYHISHELNRNYDQIIDPESREDPGNEEAYIFLRFNKNGKPVYNQCGELMYGPMTNSIPVICAVCLDLPCSCPPCVHDY